MKCSSRAIASILLLAAIFLFSCKKNDTNTNKNSFTWNYDGKNYTAAIDTAYTYSLGPYIIIGTTGQNLRSGANMVIFSLSSFNAGQYLMDSTKINNMAYSDEAGDDIGLTHGIINITTKTNNLLSGNISASLVDVAGRNHSIAGTFANVSILP